MAKKMPWWGENVSRMQSILDKLYTLVNELPIQIVHILVNEILVT